MDSRQFQINALEADVVADQLLGKPFERGARGPERYDCFGLLYALFSGCGIELDDPFKESTVDHSEFRRFRDLFVELPRDVSMNPLDILKQKRQRAHVSVYLSRGFALDIFNEAIRIPVENIIPFTTGVWRYRCLAG